MAFYNGSNYDYQFIIKVLEGEFEKQFICLGGNTGKYITFAVLIEKEVTKIDKNREETTKNISYILQFIDSARFMRSSLLKTVNNLSEGAHKIKCKCGHDDKKCETCKIKYKDDLIECKCLCCNKNYQQKFDEKLQE